VLHALLDGFAPGLAIEHEREQAREVIALVEAMTRRLLAYAG